MKYSFKIEIRFEIDFGNFCWCSRIEILDLPMASCVLFNFYFNFKRFRYFTFVKKKLLRSVLSVKNLPLSGKVVSYKNIVDVFAL